MDRLRRAIFILSILLVAVLNNWGQKFIGYVERNAIAQQQAANAMQQNATAQQHMASAQQQIAARDDVQERERELVLDHLAFTSKQILEKLERIEGRQLARAAGAGGQG